MEHAKNVLLMDHCRDAVSALIAAHAVHAFKPLGYLGRPNTSYDECLRYTQWYATDAARYRYDRYMAVLRKFTPRGLVDPQAAITEAHVDIGCGAGLFSWVFMDWAASHGLNHTQLQLYGLDHSPQYLQLSRDIRRKVRAVAPYYPALYYDTSIVGLCDALRQTHVTGANYTITFGHVLVQAHIHSPNAIAGFTKVISTMVEVAGERNTCRLTAVDARGRHADFTRAWRCLLEHMSQAGIRFEPCADRLRHGYLRR